MSRNKQIKNLDQYKDDVISVLKTVYDPEIPVSIYDLGLIYDVKTKSNGDIYIKMTLTSPNCPVAESLPPTIAKEIMASLESKNVKIDVVWEPPWNKDMMSEAAKLQLGFL